MVPCWNSPKQHWFESFWWEHRHKMCCEYSHLSNKLSNLLFHSISTMRRKSWEKRDVRVVNLRMWQLSEKYKLHITRLARKRSKSSQAEEACQIKFGFLMLLESNFGLGTSKRPKRTITSWSERNFGKMSYWFLVPFLLIIVICCSAQLSFSGICWSAELNDQNTKPEITAALIPRTSPRVPKYKKTRCADPPNVLRKKRVVSQPKLVEKKAWEKTSQRWVLGTVGKNTSVSNRRHPPPPSLRG